MGDDKTVKLNAIRCDRAKELFKDVKTMNEAAKASKELSAYFATIPDVNLDDGIDEKEYNAIVEAFCNLSPEDQKKYGNIQDFNKTNLSDIKNAQAQNEKDISANQSKTKVNLKNAESIQKHYEQISADETAFTNNNKTIQTQTELLEGKKDEAGNLSDANKPGLKKELENLNETLGKEGKNGLGATGLYEETAKLEKELQDDKFEMKNPAPEPNKNRLSDLEYKKALEERQNTLNKAKETWKAGLKSQIEQKKQEIERTQAQIQVKEEAVKTAQKTKDAAEKDNTKLAKSVRDHRSEVTKLYNADNKPEFPADEDNKLVVDSETKSKLEDAQYNAKVASAVREAAKTKSDRTAPVTRGNIESRYDENGNLRSEKTVTNEATITKEFWADGTPSKEVVKDKKSGASKETLYDDDGIAVPKYRSAAGKEIDEEAYNNLVKK